MTISKKLLIVGTLALGMHYSLQADETKQDKIQKISNLITSLNISNHPQAQEIAQWLSGKLHSPYEVWKLSDIISAEPNLENCITDLIAIKKAEYKENLIQTLKTALGVAAAVTIIATGWGYLYFENLKYKRSEGWS